MADSSPSVGELFKAKAVTDEQVNAATDAYLAERETDAHPIADGYLLDLAAAVAGHGWASQVVANPESSPGLKRGAVRTANLLAGAQKACGKLPACSGSDWYRNFAGLTVWRTAQGGERAFTVA